MLTGRAALILVAKSAAHQWYCILCYDGCEQTRHSSDMQRLISLQWMQSLIDQRFCESPGLELGYTSQVVSQAISLLNDPNRFLATLRAHSRIYG
jgi:hypothetical protein